MTTTRTDIHRPAATITEDYEYLYCMDNMAPGNAIGFMESEEGRAFWKSLFNFAPETADRNTSQCHHCGAHIRYVAFLQHVPTGRTICVGETCLDNRFSLATVEFQKIRKAAELDRKAQRIKLAALEILAGIENETVRKALGKGADLSEFNLGGSISFVADIQRKLWLYGELSARQLAAVERVIAQAPIKAAEAVARQAERDAEVECPAPVGRVTFSGVVVSRKFKDNDFGGAWKLTIKVTTEAGVWLAWVSEPSAIEAEVGDTVTMTATLSPSPDKPNFAFGKRPSKASVTPASAAPRPSALD